MTVHSVVMQLVGHRSHQLSSTASQKSADCQIYSLNFPSCLKMVIVYVVTLVCLYACYVHLVSRCQKMDDTQNVDAGHNLSNVTVEGEEHCGTNWKLCIHQQSQPHSFF